MDLIDLAQDRDRWLVFVIAVMSFLVVQNSDNFLSGRGPVSF